MKISLLFLIILLCVNPIKSNASEKILDECINYFNKNSLKIIKTKIIKASYVNEVNLVSKIKLRFDLSLNSSLAYTINNDGIWEIYYNKNIFKLFCKKQIDLITIKNIIKSESGNAMSSERNDVVLLKKYSIYWSSCVLNGLYGEKCNDFFKLNIKNEYLKLDSSDYKEEYTIKIESVKENVLDIFVFIAFHEVGHIVKNHTVLQKEKEKINLEFEADNYAFEKMVMNNIDLELAYFDIAMLPTFFFTEKSIVKKISYNSLNIRDINSCRERRISDYIYLLSIYSKILSRIVTQSRSKNKLLISEERIIAFENIVKKYSGNKNTDICGDNTNFINTKKSSEIFSYIEKFKQIEKTIEDKRFEAAIEKIQIETSIKNNNIFNTIYLKYLQRLIISQTFNENRIISYNLASKIENILYENINKSSQEDIKLFIRYLSNGVIYNKNISIEKRVEKIRKYSSVSIRYNLNQPSIYVYMGTIEVIDGNFQKAKEFYEKSISLDDDTENNKTTEIFLRLLKENSKSLRLSFIKTLRSIDDIEPVYKN